MTDQTFHGRIVNIRSKPASMIVGSVRDYANGHKDGRHAAAEIALEADTRINTLEALVRDMEEALDGVSWATEQDGYGKSHSPSGWANGYNQGILDARTALAKCKEVMG